MRLKAAFALCLRGLRILLLHFCFSRTFLIPFLIPTNIRVAFCRRAFLRTQIFIRKISLPHLSHARSFVYRVLVSAKSALHIASYCRYAFTQIFATKKFRIACIFVPTYLLKMFFFRIFIICR